MAHLLGLFLYSKFELDELGHSYEFTKTFRYEFKFLRSWRQEIAARIDKSTEAWQLIVGLTVAGTERHPSEPKCCATIRRRRNTNTVLWGLAYATNISSDSAYDVS